MCIYLLKTGLVINFQGSVKQIEKKTKTKNPKKKRSIQLFKQRSSSKSPRGSHIASVRRRWRIRLARWRTARQYHARPTSSTRDHTIAIYLIFFQTVLKNGQLFSDLK
jgi:hypothetical protein